MVNRKRYTFKPFPIHLIQDYEDFLCYEEREGFHKKLGEEYGVRNANNLTSEEQEEVLKRFRIKEFLKARGISWKE